MDSRSEDSIASKNRSQEIDGIIPCQKRELVVFFQLCLRTTRNKVQKGNQTHKCIESKLTTLVMGENQVDTNVLLKLQATFKHFDSNLDGCSSFTNSICTSIHDFPKGTRTQYLPYKKESILLILQFVFAYFMISFWKSTTDSSPNFRFSLGNSHLTSYSNSLKLMQMYSLSEGPTTCIICSCLSYLNCQREWEIVNGKSDTQRETEVNKEYQFCCYLFIVSAC